MKYMYLYLLDTMADWENGYLLQVLSLQNMTAAHQLTVKTVGRTKQVIKTAGGLTLIPDVTLDEVVMEDAAALVLIGADTWLDEEQENVLTLAADFLQSGKLVAAICGATLGLADKGLLNNRPHTSNAPFFLSSMSENYSGQAYYRDDLAVSDNNLITASSAGSLLWAKYIIEKLDLYSATTIEAWYRYFSTGDPQYYGQLLASLSE